MHRRLMNLILYTLRIHCVSPYRACQALMIARFNRLVKWLKLKARLHPLTCLCRPLLLLPSVFTSIRVFSNESVLRIRWPKYWSFSFSISASNEYSGLISFRIDLLEVQETLKSLLQHHSSKALILLHSAFFMVQLSQDYWENHSFDYMDLCR